MISNNMDFARIIRTCANNCVLQSQATENSHWSPGSFIILMPNYVLIMEKCMVGG